MKDYLISTKLQNATNINSLSSADQIWGPTWIKTTTEQICQVYVPLYVSTCRLSCEMTGQFNSKVTTMIQDTFSRTAPTAENLPSAPASQAEYIFSCCMLTAGCQNRLKQSLEMCIFLKLCNHP